MITIQIAPDFEDCRIIGNRIEGTMKDGTVYIYKAPKGTTFDRRDQFATKQAFRQAIGLSSKTHQAEWLLNDYLSIKGNFFVKEPKK